MDKRTIFFIVMVTLSFFAVNTFFTPKDLPKVKPTESIQEQASPTSIYTPPSLAPSQPDPNESFYVLENESIQLVFSSKGGALTEINLPFQNKDNSDSAVHSIEFDRQFKEDSPDNDTFPLNPSYFANAPKEKKAGNLGGYYPLLRRNILHPDGTATLIPAKYYALTIIDSSLESEPPIYQVTRLEKNLIEFQVSQAQRRITKTFTLPSQSDVPYVFDVEMKIDGDTKNLWIGSGIPEVELMSGSASPSLKYRVTKKDKPLIEKISLPKALTTVASIHPDWISNSNGFFGLILDPLSKTLSGYRSELVPGALVPTRLSILDAEYNRYPVEKFPGYQLYLPIGGNETTHFRVFSGPYQGTILKKIDTLYSDHTTGYNPDYKQAQSNHGWFSFISIPFAKFLFFLMDFFHSITHSWGVAIILLTIALRAMLYPLNSWSIRSTMKMQELAPKVKSLNERYKKDPKKAQMEIMKLYREAGANPMTGCFPVLIQMPFLFGMFDLLRSSFELRGASFIPGWIDNLTAPDVLFSWSYPLPFLGNQFHLLPILLGAVMFLQQKMASPLPKDTSQLTDQQKQTQMMTTLMPIIFTFIFYKFPSGLNLYWLSSTLLGIGQQWLMKRTQHAPKARKS